MLVFTFRFFQILMVPSLLVASSAHSRGENIVEIELKIDKQTVEVGENVQFQTLASSKLTKEVRTLGFSVLRLGYFNQKRGKIMLSDHNQFRIVHPLANLFEDLPSARIGPHGIPFDITTSHRVGYEFKAAPNRLGVFMITVRWGINENNDDLLSNPVVIMVRPPIDKNGVAKLKAEWLEN